MTLSAGTIPSLVVTELRALKTFAVRFLCKPTKVRTCPGWKSPLKVILGCQSTRITADSVRIIIARRSRRHDLRSYPRRSLLDAKARNVGI